jgi:hypothetical protein
MNGEDYNQQFPSCDELNNQYKYLDLWGEVLFVGRMVRLNL